MKKHFLLLVMALMSMTSWAVTDISGSDFAIRADAVPYGTEITAALIQVRDVSFQENLTAGTDYTLAGVYSDEACTQVAAYPQPANTTYWVKVEGTGDYSGEKKTSIRVTQKVIYVALSWAEGAAAAATHPLSKTYGAADPAFTLDWSHAQLVGTDNAATLFAGQTATLAEHSEDVTVGGVDIEITGLTADNYTVELDPAFPNGDEPALDFTKMVINPKNLNTLEVPAANLAITATYQGSQITPSFSISDGENPLTPGAAAAGDVPAYGDYYCTYTSASADKGKTVNGGTAWNVTITGQGNYTGTLGATVTITKAPMTVAVQNIKVPYKGAAYDATYLNGLLTDEDVSNDPQFVYYGFVGDDASAEASAAVIATLAGGDPSLAIATTDGKAIDANADGYALTVGVEGLTLANYALQALASQPGKLIIEKAKLTVTANTVTQVYGGEETPITFTVTPATAVANRQIAGADTPDDDTDDVYEQKFSTDPVFTHAEVTGVDDYDITLASEGVTTANFEVTAYIGTQYNEAGTARLDGTPVYRVTAAPITLVVLNHEKTYGEADPASLTAPVSGTDYIVTGLTDTSVLDGMTLVYTSTNGAAGEYQLNADFTSLGDNFTVTPIPGKFTINKKELKVTAKAQTLAIGDSETALDPDAYTIDSELGLAEGDNAAAVFTLGFNRTPGVLVDGDANTILNIDGETGVATLKDNAEGSYNAGIVVNLISNNYTWAKENNVEVGMVPGKLTVVNGATTIVLNRVASTDFADVATAENPEGKNDADLVIKTAAAAIAAEEADNYNVTFSDFTLLPEKWYPLVLPFATTVAEVSEKFNYAIVNVLSTTQTPDVIRFKLHMQELPANVPFVVKVSEEINMNTVTFRNKVIKYSDNLTVEEGDVKFIGTYKGKKGFTANQRFFSTAAGKDDYYYGSSTNQTYLRPLGAYFEVPDGYAARGFVFEEADGSTTAIQVVKSDNASEAAQGWYTIGGMKLQGAPAQKGVYIKDGKKVIIK